MNNYYLLRKIVGVIVIISFAFACSKKPENHQRSNIFIEDNKVEFEESFDMIKRAYVNNPAKHRRLITVLNASLNSIDSVSKLIETGSLSNADDIDFALRNEVDLYIIYKQNSKLRWADRFVNRPAETKYQLKNYLINRVVEKDYFNALDVDTIEVEEGNTKGRLNLLLKPQYKNLYVVTASGDTFPNRYLSIDSIKSVLVPTVGSAYREFVIGE
jgi:hypothetical protein